MARKPLIGTVAANVARYGTGAINVDACRINASAQDTAARESRNGSTVRPAGGYGGGWHGGDERGRIDLGRWPANLILDPVSAAMLDEQTEDVIHGAGHARDKMVTTDYAATSYNMSGTVNMRRLGDTGGASRFYYVCKPSREERDYGCEHLPQKSGGEATDRTDGSAGVNSPRAGAGRTGGSRNVHPTVKPVELMRWLIKLVTPPEGTVLDPFTGSGTTGMACRYESRRFIGIERDAEYYAIAKARIEGVAPLFGEEPYEPTA